jgi:glucose-1-phosphatase
MKLSDSIQANSQIKNIIFDWGGVISNLDFVKCNNAFKNIGFYDFENSYSLLKQKNLFCDFEKGLVTPDFFRKELRKMTTGEITDTDIDEAWMSMLCDLPCDRWRILQDVKEYYRTFILSNTNAIHVEGYFKYLHGIYGVEGYRHLFEKVYFSYEIGMRKPDREIFDFVLKDSGLEASETLLIDDTPQNIETAQKLGIQTYYLQPPFTLADLFEYGSR